MRLRFSSARRKPLVTRDAELFVGGEFGATARAAQAFVDTLQAGNVPLSTIRSLWRQKPAAFARVAPLIPVLVGAADLRKDFIEAIVYLEDVLADEDASLATTHRHALLSIGYDNAVAGMLRYHREHAGDRVSKVASPRMKAEALRMALNLSTDAVAAE